MKIHVLKMSAILTIMLLMQDCNTTNVTDLNTLKKEIINVEKEFETAVRTKGFAEAFYEFADENAVIKRKNDTLIKGKENIRIYYQNIDLKDVLLTWNPDFVDISKDGTLGYSYGGYLWKSKDPNGIMIESKGVFHTVWKKQIDGTWKYVWD
jgi:ketosteroid isomerase-like protein